MNIDILKILTNVKKDDIVVENRKTNIKAFKIDNKKEYKQREKEFKEILTKVKEDNITSARITENFVKIRERNKLRNNKKEQQDVSTEPDYTINDVDSEPIKKDIVCFESENFREVEPKISEKAGKLLENALKEICDTLNIKTLPIDEINFVRITESIEEQFAEILFLVEKIIEDVNNSEAIPQANKNREALLDTLLTNKFKIELALNILGISEDVHKRVDERNGVNGFDGIIKAVEPLQIKMASLHSEKMFNSLLGTEREKIIETIIEKIKQLILENNGEFTIATSEKEQKIEDVAAFDSKIYRYILKIDKPTNSEVSSENGKQGVNAISTDDKNQSNLENGSQLKNNILNSEDLLLANSRGEVSTQQNVDKGATFIPSNILKVEEIADQITTKLRSMIKNGISEVRILLKPDTLGEVKMRIRMEGDIVIAKIEVESKIVKEIMEKNLPLLREALSQHNITAGNFQIDTYNKNEDEENLQHKENFYKGDNNKNNKKEKDDNKESEVEDNNENSNLA